MFGRRYRESTLDDLMNSVLSSLLNESSHVEATRGCAAEMFGATLILDNPRARLSRSESKGKLFSSLGELLWYLSGDIDLEFINYYVGGGRYERESEDNKTVRSGYGRRLFGNGENEPNQIDNVIKLLRQRRSSRRAVIQLFHPEDVEPSYTSVPCTCTLQFVDRDDKLHMLVNMRSNDAYFGLPHDVFAFTMLQEIVARSIGSEPGIYQHCVGSLHLYDNDRDKAEAYLAEGLFRAVPMESMPNGDPWEHIGRIMDFEQTVRLDGIAGIPEGMPTYWEDFSILLLFYRSWRDNNFLECDRLKSLVSPVYRLYIEDKLEQRCRSSI